MASAAHANPKGMYSWWWDSHISPKNSKWLQENLTDMDAKVKQMIKVIEEDADSFARRAEMYYKKRPELMKLVEEFYRAYRALAERYDHATGVIRHAHRTMSEAFPNQIPMIFADDAPAGIFTEPGSHTPANALFDSDEVSKDTVGFSVKRNGESKPTAKRKGLKQLNDMFGSGEEENRSRVRKGLNFQHAAEKDQSGQKAEGRDLNAHVISDSDHGGKTEAEIMNLKKALDKLEAEREAGLLQYQQCLEKLSNLESDVSRAQEESKRLSERASSAESEVQTLREALSKLEAEKEASFQKYQQCLNKISSLEESISLVQRDAGEIDKRAKNAESEVEALKLELARVEAEKEAALVQHKQCLDKISLLEERLKDAEEHVRGINDRVDKAETEVQTLRQEIKKLSEEKEAYVHQYQQCLETISSLELKLACAEEEAKRLNSEIDDGISKLKGAEEKCTLLERSNQTLHSELESMALKMGSQREELAEKQKELGNLWTCIQEERLRFVEAETAFQTLQPLHSASQEELRSLAAELQTRAQILKEMESRSQGLEEEILKVKEENQSLNELNLSSATTIENLHREISSLRETIGKLEAEVELRVDQRNALQQEIYCLKEELNDMNKKNQNMVEQVESVGFDPESFGLSVKRLQDEQNKLREQCERDRIEKSGLLEKLEVLEKLLEKNALLENSISDLNVELEGVRDKLKELEVSYQSLLVENSTLMSEKATLISQLQLKVENLEKMSEKNQLLENSLFDANAELEELREKSKNLEGSYQLLDNEKTGLIVERETLASQLNFTQQSLDDLGKKYVELKGTYKALEEERKSTLQKLEDLQTSLDAEKEERTRFSQLSESQLTDLRHQIHLLDIEVQSSRKEYEEEMQKVVNADMEIFVLQKCIQDLEEKILSLLIESQKLLESSQLSEKLIVSLENENLGQQKEVLFLQNQIKTLRIGLHQVLTTLLIDVNHKYEDSNIQEDQSLLNCINAKIEELQNSYSKSWEENQQLVVEKLVLSTLLRELEIGAATLAAERNILNEEFGVQSYQLCALQKEIQKFKKLNKELRMELQEEDKTKEALIIVMKNLSQQLSDIKGAYQHSQEENSKLNEEKRNLTMKVSALMKEKCSMEEENCAIFYDKISLINLSLIFKDVITEKFEELGELATKMENLRCLYDSLLGKMRALEAQLEDSQMQNIHLKDSVEKLVNELNSASLVNEQLSRRYDEVKLMCEDKEKQILELSEVHQHQSKENQSLHELNRNLEAKLHEEVEETKIKEERLCCELQNCKNEVQMWQRHFEIVFGDLQNSLVCEALFKEKIHELTEICQNFEDVNDVKAAEIDKLKERINLLEDENGGIKAQVAAYIPVIISLRDCVASLENHTLQRRRLRKDDTEKIEDVEKAACSQADCSVQIKDDQRIVAKDGLLGLQDLESRIKDIENAVLEMEKLSALEVSSANKELEAVMRQIQDLKSGRKRITKEQKGGPQGGLPNDVDFRKTVPETYDTGNEVLTKDIVLDQMSEESSHGKSHRENILVDDQILELWDAPDQDGSIDLTGDKDQYATPRTHSRRHEASQRRKRENSSGSTVEKELCIDRLEISKSFSESTQEVNMKKILERLDSDAQKLTNLQITVQDLKRKVDITEKSKKGKGYDFDSVKGKLEEAEEGINKLFDVNNKLVQRIEASPSITVEKSPVELDDGSNTRRKRVSDQARRCSEKIGRLQLEVQKLQFLLLKIDEEKEHSGKAGVTGRDRRVLLRDYLYGGTRTSHKKKKASCCACMRPPTKEN